MRRLPGDLLDNILHIFNLFLYFSFGFILQHNVIPAVIPENAAAVMDQLKQLGMLLHPVSVDEEDSFGIMLVQRIHERID
ncbi:hypothetical protein D3C75_1136230 [compost metagenome]